MPPNWRYPCINCSKLVKTNQKGIECSLCFKWVHLKCTDLTKDQYEYLEANENAPFYCLGCEPRILYADVIFENTTLPTSSPPFPDINTSLNSLAGPSSPIININDSTSSLDISPANNSYNDCSSANEFSSAHSSDFEYVTDSDQENETRGLNFYALPVQNAVPANVEKNSTRNIPVRVLNYKYPCLICHKPCKEKVHDSISCTLCDEWVHQTCSDLSIKQFRTYCSPDHEGDPYYCEYCRYGYSSLSQSLGKLSCPSATTLNSIDIDNLDTISPNSIFRGKDDIILSD